MSSAEAAHAWARSGAMHLSGTPEGPPLLAPGRPALAAQEAMAQLCSLARAAGFPAPVIDGAALLAERGALSGWTRNSPWNLGGTCRALECSDGWIAVNLARAEDLSLIPALLETSGGDDPWSLLHRETPRRGCEELTSRAALLGLPLARVGASSVAPSATQNKAGSTRAWRPRVVDLSTLWAGPLAGSLLGLCGAEVTRVESLRRPDGSRQGIAGFDDLLHGGQRSVALDFSTAAGLSRLHALVESADIVITSARARALERLGIAPAKVWIAVTAYGLDDNRVGFGDDCAMAAGLCGWIGDMPVPIGDAIADPLTGLHAAAEGLRCHLAGGSWVIDAPLAGTGPVVGPLPEATVQRRGREWWLETAGGSAKVEPPRARPVTSSARPLGADT